MNRNVQVAFLTCVVMAVAGCSETKKLSNRNLASLYTPELNFTFPRYRCYNFSADSSVLYYRVKTTDFLAQQTDSSGRFHLRIGVDGILYSSYASKVTIDTLKAVHTLETMASGEVKLEGEHGAAGGPGEILTPEYLESGISFRAPAGRDYILQLFVTDINRKATVTSFVRVDRTGSQSPNDFLPRNPSTGEIIIDHHTGRPDTFYLESAMHPGKPGFLRYFRRNYPLALPPFSETDPQKLSYFSDFVTPFTALDGLQFETNELGICHVQFDTLELEGFTYFRFAEDYPKLTDAWNLIESIRYLTTRKEYQELSQSGNIKEAVDDFWISLAGNHERARVLIRSYYSRVQLANEWFTSYLEGWKSDRGLIFVIFGPPAAVYRDDQTESWNYSSSSSYGPLVFTFDLVKNPFTANDYRLRRSPSFEGPWFRAVESWREGKVVDGNN